MRSVLWSGVRGQQSPSTGPPICTGSPASSAGQYVGSGTQSHPLELGTVPAAHRTSHLNGTELEHPAASENETAMALTNTSAVLLDRGLELADELAADARPTVG
jgi:hypothetical protein